MAAVVLPRELRDQIIEHCKTRLPEEACGLLAGHVERGGEVPASPEPQADPPGTPERDRIPAFDEPDDVVKVVERVFPVENIDHSPEHFTIDPRDQLRVLKEARAEGLELLGNFHSHPQTPARPSVEDKRLLNDRSASYLIVSFASDEPRLNAFRIDGDAAFREPIDSPERG